MGFLDAYDTYVNKKCEDIKKQNSSFESLSSALGLSGLVDGFKAFMDNGIVQALMDSPLRTMAEDVLAQTIHENSRRLSQNMMNVADRFDKKYRITNTLTDVRNLVFNAAAVLMTFQNNMVLYFAAQVAQQAINAIKDKRANLIRLQEAVKRLHNALLVLAGGGPFFSRYIQDLRRALDLINQADVKLSLVESAFRTKTIFSKTYFQSAKDLLDEAYALITPPVTGPEAAKLQHSDLSTDFLKDVFVGPTYGDQLASIMVIPKLTKEMLEAYDTYALQVLKVNTLILAFQNIVSNLQEVTGGALKEFVLDSLAKTRVEIGDVIASMAKQLNGSPDALYGPVQVPAGSSGQRSLRADANTQYKTYEPNPTITTSKAIAWGVKVKACRVMLNVIDPDSLKQLETSNDALQAYRNAIKSLSLKDDRVSGTAVLRATDGREQPGDIEADIITFAVQANQAILDTSLTAKENGRFSSKTVIALGTKVHSRLQLSIDQDREIEDILLRFILATKDLLAGINQLGNSLFKVMDDLGMDRAVDALRSGDFKAFFGMNGKTASYIGAALAGLSLVQNLLADEDQRTCLNRAINRLKAEETSKKLSSNRTVRNSYAKQQERNNKLCSDLKADARQVDRCSSTLDPAALLSNPLGSLSGLFRGMFGGDIASTMGGSAAAIGGAQNATKVAEDAQESAATSNADARKEGADDIDLEMAEIKQMDADALSTAAKATPTIDQMGK